MPFLYEFYLNNKKLNGVEIGFSHSRKWEEALDEAKLSIPFYESEKPLPQFGLMEITIQEVDNYTDLNVIETETIDMLVASDRVSIVSQYGVYRHDITMIEYTAKLDTYIMASLARTRDIETDLLSKFVITEDGKRINPYIFERYYGRVWLPHFKVKQKYYTEVEYTFEQVEQAYQSKGLIDVIDTFSQVYDFEKRPVIFRYHNITTNTTSEWFNLSSADITIEFTEIGKYYIEYGIDASEIYDYNSETNISAGNYAIYKFYFSVSEYYQQTVYDALISVRNNVSKFGGIESEYYFEETRIFDIDTDIVERLKNIQIPQMYLEQATARQMLIFILSYINALPRLEKGETEDILGIEEFNLTTGDYTRENIYELSGSQNINQIGTRSHSPLKQVLPNNMDEATTYAPSQDGYQQVRADGLQIRDDSFAIKLEKEIYTPKEFVVNVPDITFENDFDDINGFNYSGNTLRKINNIDVSLAERLLNIEEWKLKIVTDNFPSITTYELFDKDLGLRNNMTENLYWQLGAKKIHLSNVYGQIVNKTLFQNVIKLSIYEYIALNLPKPFIITYRPGEEFEQEVMVVGGTQIDINLDFINDVDAYKSLRFRFAYLTLEDLIIKEEKEDLSQIDFYSEMRQNQDESIVNIIRNSRKNYGNLQRTGNKAFSFKKIHYSLSDQYEIGQVDINKFAITNKNRQFFGRYFLAEYFVTKYHNRESRQTIVDQTYRWRDNYTRSVLNRHESYTDYLVVYSPTANLETEPTKVKSDDTIEKFLEIMLGRTISNFQTRATVALLRTDGMLDFLPENSSNEEYHLLTPVSAYPTTKGLSFTFGFDSNQVAGDALVKRGENYYNQAVRYTDETGRFNKLSFNIMPKFDIGDNYEDFPRVSKARSEIYNNSYFWCGEHNLNFVGNDALIIDKDPLTNIKITYQLNAVPNEIGEYVLGQKLFTENFLVNNPNEQKKAYLYLYDNDTYYDIFDDLDIKTGYSNTIELNETNISYSQGYDLVSFDESIDLTNITSWAIGDSDKKLYIACNSNYNGYKIKAKHFRPGVKEIGVKTFILDKEFEISKTLTFIMDIDTHIRRTYLQDLVKTLEFDMEVETLHIVPILEDLNKTLTFNLDISTQHITPILENLNKTLTFNLDISTQHISPVSINLSKTLDFNMSVVTEKIEPKLENLNKTLTLNLDVNTMLFQPKLVDLNTNISLNMSLDNFSIYEKVWDSTNATIYNATSSAKKHEEASSNYPNPENAAHNYVENYVVKVTDPTLTDPTIYYWIVDLNFK